MMSINFIVYFFNLFFHWIFLYIFKKIKMHFIKATIVTDTCMMSINFIVSFFSHFFFSSVLKPLWFNAQTPYSSTKKYLRQNIIINGLV